MSLTIFGHPFSSYCWKVFIACYENDLPFTLRCLGPDDPQAAAEQAVLWPLQRMPLLVDDGRPVMESSIIVEHLALHHPGKVRLVPEDPRAALDVRFMDRCFDHYVMTPMQKFVFDALRPPDRRDPHGVEEARALLDKTYGWLNERMRDREWAAGAFSLADCAAAPALLYADWVHPIGDARPHLQAYRRRLLARPSVVRAVDDARPYRQFFPPGAPDRD